MSAIATVSTKQGVVCFLKLHRLSPTLLNDRNISRPPNGKLLAVFAVKKEQNNANSRQPETNH